MTTINEARLEIINKIKAQIAAAEARLAKSTEKDLYFLVTLDGTMVVAEGQPLMGPGRTVNGAVLSLRPINPTIVNVGLAMSRQEAEVMADTWNGALTADQERSCTVEVRSERQAEYRRLAILNEMLTDFKVCERCGELKPDGQSCLCVDNDCQ